MHKVEKKCINCKFCKITKGSYVCKSTWSPYYMENMYPDETCEVFAQKHKAKKIRKEIIAVIGIISLLASMLSGCTKTITLSNGQKYIDFGATNAAYMTELEYKDLYNAELETKLDTKKNVKERVIELYNVSDEDRIDLMNQLYSDLADLTMNVGYSGNYYIHENFKLLFDNLVQSGKFSVKMGTNSGYYYVTLGAAFKKNPEVYEMKKVANYVGIEGAIGYNQTGEETVDDLYLQKLIELVNQNRTLNGRDPVDDKIEQITYLEDVDIDIFFDSSDFAELVGTASETTVSDESEEYERKLNSINLFEEIQNEQEIEKSKKDIFDRLVRRLDYDAEEFNDTAGYSKTAIQVIPGIGTIFKLQQADTLAGYSLYNYGETINEVKNNKSLAHAELMFIYKYNLDTDEYNLCTIIPKSYESGVEIPTDGNFIDQFMQGQLKIKVEELRSAINDIDLIALTSGNLIYPQDLGISLLYRRNTTNQLDSYMWIENILRKEGNTYLADVYELTTEVPKGVETTGQEVLRKWYIRFMIDGTNCVIDDMYLHSMNCLRIPELEIEKGYKFKLYKAQSNPLEITEELKEVLRNELNKLAIGLTYRKAYDSLDSKGNAIKAKTQGNTFITDPKTKALIPDENGVPAYGFVTRFNDDTTILTGKNYSRYIAEMQQRVTKYGNQVPCTVTIKPAEWLSGDKDQVILLTNFLFDFGNNAEIYVYYMVLSNFKNNWVIDELTLQDTIMYDGKDQVLNARKAMGLVQ